MLSKMSFPRHPLQVKTNELDNLYIPTYLSLVLGYTNHNTEFLYFQKVSGRNVNVITYTWVNLFFITSRPFTQAAETDPDLSISVAHVTHSYSFLSM